MEEAGVPIVPGATEAVESLEDAAKIADIGYPVAIKASGGGGGKGFRVALEPDELAEAFEGAAREGEKFFSDDTVYLERYLDGSAPRRGAGHRRPSRQHRRSRHQRVLGATTTPKGARRKRRRQILHDRDTRAPSAAIVGGGSRQAIAYDSLGTVEYLVDDETGQPFYSSR